LPVLWVIMFKRSVGQSGLYAKVPLVPS